MRLASVFVALALVSLTACGGKSKTGSTTQNGSGSDTTSTIAKKVLVSFGIEAASGSADVFLQTTDETGKQVSHPLGTFKGQCAVFSPAPAMEALTGVRCMDGATGYELHAVVHTNQIVVLKLKVDDGVTPDPMAREELTRVAFPAGAAVEAG